MDILIRSAVSKDSENCGHIIYRAFKGIANQHGYPPDFSNSHEAIDLARIFINHPSIFSAVAENNSQIVGSIFLHKHCSIFGIGPITVEPDLQHHGIGRRLMLTVLERAPELTNVYLTQAAYNMSSLSLYLSLGFDVKEPLLVMSGKIKDKPSEEVEVRPLKSADLDECAVLCRKIYGFDRTQELSEAIKHFFPVVALRRKKIIAYASAITSWAENHGVAENDEDMCALLLGVGAISQKALSFLIPTHRSNFFRWCIHHELRTISPRMLMVKGEYQKPKGCYLPSVLY